MAGILKNELSQYLFNNDIVNEYLDNLKMVALHLCRIFL